MAASTIDPSIRAAAIADLLSGDQPAEVAERYKLNRNTVKSWATRLDADASTASDTPRFASADAPEDLPVAIPALASSHSIGALILDLLRAKLQASQAIAAAAANPAWLDRQSAADLATLGEYLDRSAFALGDRLAGQPGGDRADGA